MNQTETFFRPTIKVGEEDSRNCQILIQRIEVPPQEDLISQFLETAEAAQPFRAPVTNTGFWSISRRVHSHDDFDVKKAAATVIHQLFLEEPGMSLSRTAVHKILYRTQSRAPSGNPVRDILPYYWYNYGPYSEIVDGAIALLKRAGMLVEEEDHKGVRRLRLRDPILHDVPLLESAEPFLRTAYEEFLRARLGRYVEQIYRDDAPFRPFMPLFTQDYLKPLERFVNAFMNGVSSIGDPGSTSDRAIRSLERTLYACEDEYVDDPLFDRFNDHLSSLVTDADRVYQYILDEHAVSETLLRATLTASSAVWIGFAHGVRIHPSAHNSYYRRRVPLWKYEYERELKAVDLKLNAFTDLVRESVLKRRTHNTPLDEAEKRVLSSIYRGTVG